jgi:glycosyltransferase involved in cell wall biosynthesis
LQTGVQDEPAAVRASGALAYWAYRKAHLYLSVSPGLSRAYIDAGLAPSRLRQLCNAVDAARFRPPAPDERAALRRELGLPPGRKLVLFVGFFSRDKRPDLLHAAWSQTAGGGQPSALVFVGATRATYQEIDAGSPLRFGSGRRRPWPIASSQNRATRSTDRAPICSCPSIRRAVDRAARGDVHWLGVRRRGFQGPPTL